MEKLISKESELSLIKLGLYQIVGGSIGILSFLWIIYKNQWLLEFPIFTYLFILLFFSYSIFCGRLCLKTKRNALRHSLVNQVLQIIGITLFGFSFHYAAGVFFTIEIDLTESILFDMGIGISKFEFSINKDPNKFQVAFNLIAFGIAYWIDKLMQNIKKEMEIRNVAP